MVHSTLQILFISLFIMLIVIPIFLILKNYIRIPLHQLAIIYGRTHKRKNIKTGEIYVRGYRLIKGGTTLVLPILEKVEYLDLTAKEFDYQINGVLTQDEKKVNFKVFIMIGFAQTVEKLELAVEYFRGKTTEGINKKVQQIAQKLIEGIIKQQAKKKLFYTINNSLTLFGKSVQEELNDDLLKTGLEVISFKIIEIKSV